MKKSFSERVIKLEKLAGVVSQLHLSSHEQELVMLKLSILLENRLVDWVLSQLSLNDQKKMADMLFAKEKREDAFTYLGQRIPEFIPRAKKMIGAYEEELLAELRTFSQGAV